MRVLVVDDSATQRSLIKVFLSGYRLEFVDAANGVEALRAAHATTPLDLVVTDLNMPEMGGVELVERLRRSEDPKLYRVPIIVLTAEKSTDWIERARAAGADALCQKPVSKSDLLSHVTRELGLSSSTPPTPRSPPASR